MSDEQAELKQHHEKLKIWLSFVKFLLGTVAIGGTTIFVNAQIQSQALKSEERRFNQRLELDRLKNEQQALGKYTSLALDKDLNRRIRFAHYFATLTTSKELKAKWNRYLADLKLEEQVLKKDIARKSEQLVAQTSHPDPAKQKIASIALQNDIRRLSNQLYGKPVNPVSTLDRVKLIVAEHLGLNFSSLNPESSFIDDLGADSLDTVEMVMAFEEEFGVEIPDDAAEKLLTVGDAVKFIKNEIHKSSPNSQ